MVIKMLEEAKEEGRRQKIEDRRDGKWEWRKKGRVHKPKQQWLLPWFNVNALLSPSLLGLFSSPSSSSSSARSHRRRLFPRPVPSTSGTKLSHYIMIKNVFDSLHHIFLCYCLSMQESGGPTIGSQDGLQGQGTVSTTSAPVARQKPRVRARRGQATDPHSIAERVYIFIVHFLHLLYYYVCSDCIVLTSWEENALQSVWSLFKNWFPTPTRYSTHSWFYINLVCIYIITVLVDADGQGIDAGRDHRVCKIPSAASQGTQHEQIRRCRCSWSTPQRSHFRGQFLSLSFRVRSEI